MANAGISFPVRYSTSMASICISSQSSSQYMKNGDLQKEYISFVAGVLANSYIAHRTCVGVLPRISMPVANIRASLPLTM